MLFLKTVVEILLAPYNLKNSLTTDLGKFWQQNLCFFFAQLVNALYTH